MSSSRRKRAEPGLRDRDDHVRTGLLGALLSGLVRSPAGGGELVQALLGHSTIVMTMRYTHVVPTALRQAISTLTTHRPEPVHELWAPGGQQWVFPASPQLTAGIV
jgi:integrase